MITAMVDTVARALGILSDVLHAHVQLVADDHVVAEDEHQPSDERQVEVACALGRRAELHGDLLDVELFGCVGGCGQFTRKQQHGADAAQAPADGADHEAGLRRVDECGSDDGAHGLADDLSGAVEGGHGTTVFLGNAIGQNRHTRCDHAVQANLQQRPGGDDGRQCGGDGGQVETEAGNRASDDDPWRTLAEAAMRGVGQRTEDDVGNQGEDDADGVHRAENRLALTDAQRIEAGR